MIKRKGFTIIEVVLTIALLTIMASIFFPILAWLTVKSKNLQYESEAGGVLQEAVEATYNKLLSDWDDDFNKYQEGVFFHPAADGDNKWILSSGEEDGVNGRFTRRITLQKICRNKNTGEYKAGVTGCTGEWSWDKNSKLIKAYAEWNENGKKKSDEIQLLMAKL